MLIVEALLRWLHIIAGIVWIGLLYFFNFVNGPFAKTLTDAETKKKVVPELMPRALYWFRWGAAWTWITGVLLILLVHYHGRQSLSDTLQASGGMPTAANYAMLAVTFLGFIVYDILWKSPLAKNQNAGVLVSFVLLGVVVFLFGTSSISDFGYRGMLIHTGALFGTIMAFNVWFRIWPAQQKIIGAVKAGQAPDAALVGLAGLRSKHNTYLSVPLIWAMINPHNVEFAGGKLGLSADTAWIGWMVMVAIGWALVWHLYKIAGKVKGF